MGARMLRAQLNREGFDDVGRKRVSTLMERMGVGAIYKKKWLQKFEQTYKWIIYY